MTPSIVAFIPARMGSKRVKHKNMRLLGGRPLIDYTADAATASGIFDAIYICSDDPTLCLRQTGFIKREPVPDDQPDIVWVREALTQIQPVDAFAILRPTSPFRTPETIRRAWSEFQQRQPCDSIRAVEPVTQHPSKMWVIQGFGPMRHAFPGSDWHGDDGLFVPAHSRPTQSLWPYYIQNASLEIAWTSTVRDTGTISGTRVVPFFTQGYEGFDINTEDDWQRAASLVRDGLVAIPNLAPQTPVTPSL